jgi:hypothetical protein
LETKAVIRYLEISHFMILDYIGIFTKTEFHIVLPESNRFS